MVVVVMGVIISGAFASSVLNIVLLTRDVMALINIVDALHQRGIVASI
jgi:hypothetical protein